MLQCKTVILFEVKLSIQYQIEVLLDRLDCNSTRVRIENCFDDDLGLGLKRFGL